jgi:hypothetical protein
MNERQVKRLSTVRALETEHNLACKPVVVKPEDWQLPDRREPGIVERMPSRPAETLDGWQEDMTIARSAAKRKAQAPAKRQSVAPQANQKASQALRQVREGMQMLTLEEVKCLEAYVERINQLLVARTAQRQSFQQQVATQQQQQFFPAELSARSGAKPGVGNVLERLSDRELAQADTEYLQAKAAQIRQMLAELEADILQEQAEERWAPTEPTKALAPDLNRPFHAPVAPVAGSQYRTATPPAPTPSWPRPPIPNWQQAEQDAETAAEVLRYLANRGAATVSAPTAARGPNHRPAQGRRPSQGQFPGQALLFAWSYRLRSWLQLPAKPLDRIGDALLWVVVAAVARVAFKLLVTLNPALGPVMQLSMLLPAAIAVLLALYVPKAGAISVYRLFLIMLGLLLGGRL